MNSITLPRHREDRSPAFNSINVLIAAKQACEIHGINPSTFGREAANDGRLIADLERGRTLRPETEQRVRAYIESLGTPIRRTMDTRPSRLRRAADKSPLTTTAADATFRAKMARASHRLLKAIVTTHPTAFAVQKGA